MKKIILILILLIAVFIGGFVLFYSSRFTKQDVPIPSKITQQTNTGQNLESKTDDQSAVVITVTPIDISPKLGEWKFDVVISTHSVELDQDLMKVAVILDDQGKEYMPIGWNGPVGGHHMSGILKFVPITTGLSNLTLKIKDVGGVSERVFTWPINN